jgi:hypothetical protein
VVLQLRFETYVSVQFFVIYFCHSFRGKEIIKQAGKKRAKTEVHRHEMKLKLIN